MNKNDFDKHFSGDDRAKARDEGNMTAKLRPAIERPDDLRRAMYPRCICDGTRSIKLCPACNPNWHRPKGVRHLPDHERGPSRILSEQYSELGVYRVRRLMPIAPAIVIVLGLSLAAWAVL